MIRIQGVNCFGRLKASNQIRVVWWDVEAQTEQITIHPNRFTTWDGLVLWAKNLANTQIPISITAEKTDA